MALQRVPQRSQEGQGRKSQVQPKDGSGLQLTAVDGRRASVIVPNDPDLIDILAMNGVDISVSEGDSGNGLFNFIGNLLFPILGLRGIVPPFRRAGGWFPEGPEVVDFLKNPDKVTLPLGAKIPKRLSFGGSTLVPGKTLLARAVGRRGWGAVFLLRSFRVRGIVCGSGCVESAGPCSRRPSRKRPCIVFIDEIDAVGGREEQVWEVGNDEREQTINQLLTEMDGFSGNTVPDVAGRVKILRLVHSRGKALAKDVDFDKIARRTLLVSRRADLQTDE
ncbi:hypothetical protein L3X38_006497 [Prunus dulcis]|uniref:ATPase AAA-type core domain-containing protein n=1 Tax=Prunus dulcis TaxID=3755 RepID=A0AAD4ZSQ4_PRUDU|nr:hypothetical protein L3X38_006497 [Prunus dulcis]